MATKRCIDDNMQATTMNLGEKEFHIAPMIDVSTVEFRYFIRLLTKRSIIWSQMVVAETLVYRNREAQEHAKETASCELPPSYTADNDDDNDTNNKEEDVELTKDLIRYCNWYDGCPEEGVSPHPTICQIGSNNPTEAAFATRIVQRCGYDSIDLNCECPSDRVAGRCFGAALMKDPESAASVVKAMVETSKSLEKPLPVSVKTRIGVDEFDSFEYLQGYIQQLVDVGCTQFIIHARKVFTEGLNPAQNRTIPPLDYPCVYRLMNVFPQCSFLMNGGINGLEHARKVAFGSGVEFDKNGNGKLDASNEDEEDNVQHSVPCQRCNLPQGSCLQPLHTVPPNLRGVMVGRLARDRPADLADVDRYFYGEATNPCKNRRELMNKYISFLERVHPRRCSDDDETVSLDMVMNMPTTVIPVRQCCSVCKEFRCREDDGRREGKSPNIDMIASTEDSVGVHTAEAAKSNKVPSRRQGNKRARRHAKYQGAKIVTRIIDRALQPTWGVLAGERGQKGFRRVSHELSRDKEARNCGPGYILWKAMKAVPDEIWDKPFELTGAHKTNYYPTK